MNEQYDRLLNQLFDELDFDSSGYLDASSFVLLGEAMTGEKVSSLEATAQLERADIDGDGMVSRSEFLQFSLVLTKLDEYTFSKLIKGYIESVRKRKENKIKEFS